ncbi:hypothetical protein [Brevundimonas variabilis]|uniref:PepSY domain-containing protein n=1 Tax=Brevundimonas variabilis TaxID=74312 RepID=A0A7W9FCP4_9CAUL|nr:hypothetical protein [Brevundimonas variabilis]MBB5744626.1 hypothetical protein [Brevundimonas variabilis]
MTRNRVILIAMLIGSMPVATAASAQTLVPASAQASPAVALFAALADDQQTRDRIRERGRDDDDRDRFEERLRERGRDRDDRRGSDRSANPGDAARAVASGRDGRMLGIRPAGDGFVVRWEYPGGRVSDIRVDGRTGRVSGD